jgi:hypothetical protein
MPAWSFAMIGVICWLVSVGMFALSQHEQEKSRAFMSVARPAIGKFVGYVFWKGRKTNFSRRKSGRSYKEIEFETEAGQKVRFVATSSGNTAFTTWSAKPKSEYRILYDPNNPSRAQLDAEIDKAFWILDACAIFCAIAGGVFMLLWLRRLSA